MMIGAHPAGPPASLHWQARFRAGNLPRVSIYVLVFALVAVLIAPAIGLLAYAMHQQIRERELDASRHGEQLAEDIAQALEGDLRVSTTMLGVFAESGWLQQNQLKLLHHRAQSALAGTDQHLIVLDAELNQLLNTRVPFGSPLGKTADPETARKVLETGSMAVSNLFHGRVADTMVFDVARPVVLEGGRRLILIMTRNAADLTRLFEKTVQARGWQFGILDGAGRVAAQTVGSEQGLPAECRDQVLGLQETEAATGVQYVFDRRLSLAPWTVCVWGDAGELVGGAGRRSTVIAGATLWVGAALLAAVLLSAAISRAISRTARLAEDLDAGREVIAPASFIRDVDDVRQSLGRAAANRQRKEQELKLLAREAAHRAKNQIALAAGLVSFSSRTASSVEELRSDVIERLSALGRSVDVLMGGRASAPPLKEHIRVHLEPFIDSGKSRLNTHGDEVFISAAAAQSLSLILHELATNATKYGAWSRPDGSVAVTWRTQSDELLLDWTETDAAAVAPDRTGFGTSLVNMLVEKGFRGRIERHFDERGFRCRIVLPLDAITPNGDGTPTA